jgi:hypothetical protein
MVRIVAHGLRPRHRASLALFALLATQPLTLLVFLRTPVAIAAIGLLAIAVRLRDRPLAVGLLILCTSAVMRLGFPGIGYGDQIAVSHSALERVLAGGSPYGVGYASTTPPGAPFPYGPLGLIWWLPGPIIEFAAALGMVAVLMRERAWLSAAFIAGWYPSVALSLVGVNDFSPGLLLLVAMIGLRSHRVLGAGLLAVAAAIKPYAFAWYLPAIGYGGLSVLVVLLVSTAILWSPLFLWWGGVSSFMETVRLAAKSHPDPGYSVNAPSLRWLALPYLVLSIVARRWEDMVIFGSAVFVILLFLDKWASNGYWLAVLPVLGLALELRFLPDPDVQDRPRRRRGDARPRPDQTSAIEDGFC